MHVNLFTYIGSIYYSIRKLAGKGDFFNLIFAVLKNGGKDTKLYCLIPV